ncbi:MAG: hypothetical protein U5R48_15600 [Gammaproteobacteria bacterium]|nr:hypothetical protein [Gammaproteobacteria bacterium]
MRLIGERLHVWCRVADDSRLTVDMAGQIVRTGMVETITKLAQQIGAVLVVLTRSAAFGLATKTTTTRQRDSSRPQNRSARTPGATILMPHHLSKGAVTAGAEKIDQSSMRGASALVDGARWAMVMATMRRDLAAEYQLEPDQANRYVRFDLVKANHVAPLDGIWCRRGVGGALEPVELADAIRSARPGPMTVTTRSPRSWWRSFGSTRSPAPR